MRFTFANEPISRKPDASEMWYFQGLKNYSSFDLTVEKIAEMCGSGYTWRASIYHDMNATAGKRNCIGSQIISLDFDNCEKSPWENNTEKYEKAITMTENRNYGLFSKLAGLRTWEDAIVPTRGWPEDLTEDIQEEVEYLFSPSYFDYCELKALAKTQEAISYYWDEDAGFNVIEDWLTYINFILDAYGEYYPKPGECRIVFAFDN